MAPIKILLQYGGEWIEGYKFVNFKADGILLQQHSTYTMFMSALVSQLSVDTTKHTLDVQYQIEENFQPISIKNDMSVQLYIEQKKDTNMCEYPVCISFKEKNQQCGSGSSDIFSNMNMLQISNTSHNINIPEVLDNIIASRTNDIDGEHIEDITIIDNPEHDFIEEYQVYKDKATLQSVVTNYILKHKCETRVDRSSTKRYSVVCANSQCTWMIRSSSLNGSGVFMIRKFNSLHTCPLEERMNSHRRVRTDVIGNILKDRLSDPKTVYTPKDIIKELKKTYGLTLNYMRAWRCKEKAIELLRGDPKQAYGKIPSYLYVLNKANPGSVTKLKKAEDDSFLYVFIALKSFIHGWNHSRPVMVVDGSFLSGVYGGTMLIACTLDGSGHILPLAYAVVDSENDASWEWFFNCISEAYGVKDGMCVVSDRHESIAKAVRYVYPDIPHCVCVFHLWNNIKVKFKKSQKKLKGAYFSTIMAYTEEEFEEAMTNLEAIDSRVKDYLYNIGYQRWKIAHAPCKRTFFMTSNVAESVNAANMQARKLPILALLEYMTDMFQMWTAKNRQFAMDTFTPLGEKFQEILNENIIASKKWSIIPSTDLLYKVVEGQQQHIVDLQANTCTCRKYQLDEIACEHTIAFLDHMHIKPDEYCASYYKKASILQTYEIPVYPIQGDCVWNVPAEVANETVLPPHSRKPPGRPKTCRIKSAWERPFKRARIACARCGQEGHNHKTCKNAPIRM